MVGVDNHISASALIEFYPGLHVAFDAEMNLVRIFFVMLDNYSQVLAVKEGLHGIPVLAAMFFFDRHELGELNSLVVLADGRFGLLF